MILSHQKQFIFIHVPKVAGKSVKAALEPFNSRPYHLAPYSLLPYYLWKFPRLFSGYYHAHIAAFNLKKKLPASIFDSYYKFAFVRNPWDRMVSSYHYLKKSTYHKAYPYVVDKSFKEFLRWRLFDNNGDPLYTQSYFLMDEQGNPLVNYIGKFEHLQEDFNFICEKVGMPQINLPVVNKTQHKEYRGYYDDETIAWVEEKFREDIRNFDYVY